MELADQVEVLRWLGSVTNYMDISRVGIHGWSYGGYLSLMGLVKYPDFFKVTNQCKKDYFFKVINRTNLPRAVISNNL